MRVLLHIFSFCYALTAQSCLILFLADGEQVLVANHEDWFAKDAAVRVIPANTDRYASVIFTFESEGWAQGGINEHGLFFDGAYTPYYEVSFTGKEKYTGYIWQDVLDKCKNVEEALKFISRYALPELSEAHIVLADAAGNAVLIGVSNGQMSVKRSKKELLQTNFNPWHPDLSDEPVCERYQKAIQILRADASDAKSTLLEVLRNTHQDSLTVYSNIYDLKNKTISVVDRRKFDEVVELPFSVLMEKGDCMMPVSELSEQIGEVSCIESSFLLRGKVVDQDGKSLPFVNIGIAGTDAGTISDPDGTYELYVDEDRIADDITFSSIGYETKRIRIGILRNGPNVVLVEKATVLEEVVVQEKRSFKIARLGHMGGKDGVLPFDTIQGGGAVAVLLESPEKGFYVDKLQYRLLFNSKDTSRFRLHFFEYDSINDGPGKELLDEEIFLEGTKRFGWERFDLRSYGIYIPNKKFFVAYEWVEERAQREKMLEGLKDWEDWKRKEYVSGNSKVELVNDLHPDGSAWTYYKYHGNMMNWPGWEQLPPFTGLMVETGKTDKTQSYRTFERRTSFSPWIEKRVTLNSVVVISY